LPVVQRRLPVTLYQPALVIAIVAGTRLGRGVVVERPDLIEHEADAPTIEQNVMKTPYQPMAIGPAQYGNAHRMRVFQIEAARQIAGKKGRQFRRRHALVRLMRQATPHQHERFVVRDHLHRVGQARTQKTPAQSIVTIDDLLPRPLEPVQVEPTIDAQDELLVVSAGIGRQ